MNKQQLINMAKDTLAKINKADDIYSKSILFTDDVPLQNCKKDGMRKIFVKNIDCVDVTRNLSNCLLLNFASARNPGGGWLNGAVAQEKCIARRSTLYKSIVDNDFYNMNNSKLYSDAMIYSPNVKVIKNEAGIDLTNSWDISVLSAAAVNRSKLGYTDDKLIDKTMIYRINKIINIAINNNHRNIVLGAWGCGVFKNDPDVVAKYFYKILIEDDLAGYFDNIVFAVYKNAQNFDAFKNVFKNVK